MYKTPLNIELPNQVQTSDLVILQLMLLHHCRQKKLIHTLLKEYCKRGIYTQQSEKAELSEITLINSHL